jgi:LacI family transcriptional regulator
VPVKLVDIAKAAGVSTATVSRVLNGNKQVNSDTIKNVLRIADAMGYHPHVYAQGLASKKKNRISMLIPVMSNYFITEILRGVQDSLQDEEYELNIVNINNRADTFTQVENIIKRRWSEGYILISLHMSEDQYKQLKKIDVPLCLVDDSSELYDSVCFNNRKGAYIATKHFLENSCKRIAFILANPEATPIKERLKGYKQALSEYGIPFDESLVHTGSDMDRDGFNEKNGYQAMLKILDMDPLPDACFCASDTKAFGAYKAMKERGIEIPIIGFDNLSVAQYIGLSSVYQPMYDMGYRATKKLISRIDHPCLKVSSELYHPELLIRESSGF